MSFILFLYYTLQSFRVTSYRMTSAGQDIDSDSSDVYVNCRKNYCVYCTHNLPDKWGARLAHLQHHIARGDIRAVKCDTETQVISQAYPQTHKDKRSSLPFIPSAQKSATTQASALRQREPKARKPTPYPNRDIKNTQTQPLQSTPLEQQTLRRQQTQTVSFQREYIDITAEEEVAESEAEYNPSEDSMWNEENIERQKVEAEPNTFDAPPTTREQMNYWSRHRRHNGLSTRDQLNLLFDKVTSIAYNVDIHDEILTSSGSITVKSPSAKRKKTGIFDEMASMLKAKEPQPSSTQAEAVEAQSQQKQHHDPHSIFSSPSESHKNVQRDLTGQFNTATTKAQISAQKSLGTTGTDYGQYKYSDNWINLEGRIIKTVAKMKKQNKDWIEIEHNENEFHTSKVPYVDYEYDEVETGKVERRVSLNKKNDYGVFAAQFFSQGTIIMEYIGIMQKATRVAGARSITIGDICIDATEKGNYARYLIQTDEDHKANCVTIVTNFQKVGIKVFILALKTVHKNDELVLPSLIDHP